MTGTPCSRCGHRETHSTFQGVSRQYPLLPSHLLQSNAPLDYEETVSFRKNLEDARSDKFWLERRISYMENALSTYRRNLQFITQVVYEHERIIASCTTRHLPAEIVLEIAFMTIENGSIDVFDCSRGPWYMAQVCRKWRNVLINSTHLWSRLNIDLSYSLPRLENAGPLLMTYMDRSGDQPLHLIYHSKHYTDCSATLLGILASRSHRWKTLHMPKLLLQMLPSLQPARSKLDLLEELSLSSTQILPAQIDVFSNSPKLCRVSVNDFPNFAGFLALPWPQLTSYSGFQDKLEDHLVVLQKTPNIVQCSLSSRRCTKRGDDNRNRRRVTRLNTLQRLELYEAAFAALESIRAPNLEVLQIENVSASNIKKGSFNAFISACRSLKVLSLPSCLATDEISSILRADTLSTLEVLTLELELSHTITDLDVILQVLEYREDSYYSLPHLEHLTLSVYHSPGTRPNTRKLVQMVESRWRIPDQIPTYDFVQITKLRSFKLEMNSTWDISFENLEVLRNEGLDVTLRLR
ncbi:hypothetical protein VKT23_001712 [Stygiomarasmius scandens]|uniref:F-box domain-containing protein n=1 Tax=Marasmiellus scandens TaxID=2682957 RepID=A0ABR1K5Y3_9AGAR